jgi:hypothetical protein
VRLIIVRTIVVIVPFIAVFVLNAVSLLALGFTILKPDQKPVLIGFDKNLKTVIFGTNIQFQISGGNWKPSNFLDLSGIFLSLSADFD